MNLKSLLQKSQSHFIALGIFFIVIFIFCKPGFENKVILSTDAIQFDAMYNNMASSSETKENKIVLWNRNLFAGMPFNFEQGGMESIISKFFFIWLAITFFPKLLGIGILNLTASYFFMSCISFYVLARILKFNYWVAIFSALAFAFSLQTSILIIAGHHTKLISLGMLPMVIAGLVLIYEKKYWIGSVLSILAFANSILWAHYQMVFYTIVSIAVIAGGYFFYAYNKKESIKHIVLSMVMTVLVMLVSIGFFIPKLMSYEEYSKETIRGGSKISTIASSTNTPTQKKGLDKEYAFSWSYGIAETLTFIAPDVYGGASGGRLGAESTTYSKLSELGVQDDQALNITNSLDTYWGKQPFTLGPIYFGIIVCLLAIFAVFFVRSWLTWSLLTLTVLTVLIAWGKNFSTLNYFIFDTLPYYNKFRAPTMMLTITQFSITLLAGIGLQFLFELGASIKKEKVFSVSYISSLIFFLLLGLFYLSGDFKSPQDSQLLEQLTQMTGGQKEIANGIYNSLTTDRQILLKNDIFKLVILCLIFIGLVWAYIKNKLNATTLVVILGITMFVDNFQESKDYLFYDKFQENPTTLEDENRNKLFPKTQADLQILQDKDSTFRVFDLSSRNPFSDATSSFYHRNVGGYHAAKLSIYQDLIDSQISRNNHEVFNMLNTKYFVRQLDNGQKIALQNPDACGPCWFINEVKIVPDTRTEMTSLTNFNPKKTAFVEKKYESLLLKKTNLDTAAKIKITKVSNDAMVYESESKTPQFAVFSEIFYDKFWQAYIDGKAVPTIKTNYVLRGLEIPAGKHKIEFFCELKTFNKGVKYQNIASFIFMLLLFAAIYFDFYLVLKKSNNGKKK